MPSKQQAHSRDPILKGGRATDIVIPIMGATGAGKSNMQLVNKILGENRALVGHTLISCTSDVSAFVIDPIPDFPQLSGRRLVIVDTPGFDDTYTGDFQILERIARWLEASYRRKMKIGGVIFVYDISQDRLSGTSRRNLQMFGKLCGESALSKVIFATTKWDRLTTAEIGAEREAELMSMHWKSMIEKRSEVRRFADTEDSTGDIIRTFLHRAAQRQEAKELGLLIQRELADDNKFIPETQAGQMLLEKLQEVLDMHERVAALETAEGEEDPETEVLQRNMRQLAAGIEKFKLVSLPQRIRRWLRLLVST